MFIDNSVRPPLGFFDFQMYSFKFLKVLENDDDE